MKKHLFGQQLEANARFTSVFFTISSHVCRPFPPPPSEHLLRGGTMTQGLKGIQSLSERLSVPD